MNTLKRSKCKMAATAIPLGRRVAATFGRIIHPLAIRTGNAEAIEARILQDKWRLTKRQMSRIKMIAALRGESLEAAFHKTIYNLMMAIPARIIERNVLRGLKFDSLGLENGITKLVLSGGRTFYGYPSRLKHISLFFTFADMVPAGVSAETYAACLHAVVRYQHGGEYKYFPGPGGVVIEGGAYLGYKAIRMAEIVAETGRIIAIEIGRRNYELLRKNVEANGMQGVITPLHCGIWKSQGQMTAEFEYANAYHLSVPDEHDFCNATETVPTDTLDSIIDNCNLETVDFLNLQLNGSELEGLQGLQKRFNDVKVIRVAAYYTRDGIKQIDPILKLLRDKGCKILAIGRKNSVIAATPRFAGSYVSRLKESN